MVEFSTIIDVFDPARFLYRAELRSTGDRVDEKNISLAEKELRELIPDEEDFIAVMDVMNHLPPSLRTHGKAHKFWEAYKKKYPPKPKPNSSNEKAIRQAMVGFMEREYPDHVIQHEFTSWSLPVRPDIAAFGEGENPIVLVEIKSDKDSFDRIYRQLSEYQNFSTSIWLALDEKHLSPFLNKYGSRFPLIGVLVYNNEKLTVYKKPYIQPSLGSLYSLLWLDELKLFIRPFKGRSKLPYKDSIGLGEAISVLYTRKEIEEISQALFLWRVKRYGKCGGCIFNEIDIADFCLDMDSKQKVFTALTDPKAWRGRGEVDNRLLRGYL